MDFTILSNITSKEVIARNRSIKNLVRLKKFYGDGNWLKMKGNALIQHNNGRILNAEIHWYEANGIGKFEYKIKRIL